MRTLPLAVLFVAAGLLAAARPAAACDPEWDWCGWDPWPAWDAPVYEEPAWTPAWEPVYEPEPLAPAPWYEPAADVAVWDPPAAAAPVAYEAPAYSAPAYEPVYQAPVYEPAAYEAPLYEPIAYVAPVYDPPPAPAAPSTAWIDPGYDETPISVVPTADMWVEAARMGVHRVTDTYLSASVVTDGRTTVFGTTTLHEDPGTAARAVATVGTGEASGYESVLWNGRNRRSDGSLVRGTVYENFVWNGVAWVHDKYVFFQDDAETAPLAPAAPPPPVQPPPPPVPSSAPSTPAVPVPAAVVTTPPAVPPDAVAPAPPGPAAAPAPSPAAAVPPRHDVQAGIALGPEADVLARIEVLRGRPVLLWARALVDGGPGHVTSWRLAGGEVTSLGAIVGAGDDPFTATWEQVSPPGSTFAVTLDVEVSVPGEGDRTVSATITVAVRSPAIVE